MKTYDTRKVIEVEYGIPIPPKGQAKARYPFHQMRKVGASFFVPFSFHDDNPEKAWNALTSSCRWAAKKLDYGFTIRQEAEGLRIWRVR